MRAIAEYIVRGRSQAVIVALIGSWVPILTQATLSLVTLRKGPQEGVLVMMWALLPSLAAFWLGDVSLVLAVSSIAAVLISLGCAVVLRATVSWPAVLAALIALSCLTSLITVWLSGDIVGEMKAFVYKLMGDAKQEDIDKLFRVWSVTWCASVVAFWTATSAFVGLIVARWWQAMLFNPGGFRQEFHGLRLNHILAVLCGCSLFYCKSQGFEYHYWSKVFAFPLVVAGLGLTHAAVAKHRLARPVLALAYLGLLLPPVELMLALVGLTDVWLDYRKRYKLMQ